MRTGLLLSGGMDSVAVAHWKKPDVCYTIDYGQLPAPGEIRAASAVCSALGLIHRVITVNCRELGSGDLAGKSPSSAAPASEWWPFRNQLLLTFAGAVAINDGVTSLMMGTVKSDRFHQDGHPEFFKLINDLMVFQEGACRVDVPAIHLTTKELIAESQIPFSVLAWSHSCHASDYACGLCRGCAKHALTMKELGHGDY